MKLLAAVLCLLLFPGLAIGSDLDLCSLTGKNPLWLLVKNNKEYTTPSLVKNNETALPGDALSNAVAFGYKELVSNLITKPELIDKYGGDALATAAAMGRLDMSRILLTGGVPANTINKTGTTAIYGAVQYGCVDEVRLLIKYGADVNFRGPYDNTPMIEAVADGHYIVAAVLLKNGYKPLQTELKKIKSILMERADVSVWEYLFEGDYN